MSEHRELRGAAGVFGTAKEEFDIGTGYWKKWQRVEAENEALRERVRQMEEALQDKEELIRWTAQSVHQAYHQHKSGTFRECSMNICRAATDALEVSGAFGDSTHLEQGER